MLQQPLPVVVVEEEEGEKGEGGGGWGIKGKRYAGEEPGNTLHSPPPLLHTHTHTHSEDGEEEEDLVGSAEEEFWANLAQEQKEIESKEQKRREALLPKDKPTPIPEEGAEISAEETKVGLALTRAANVSCFCVFVTFTVFCCCFFFALHFLFLPLQESGEAGGSTS